MKSITMTSDSWDGIPATQDAFTVQDEKTWFETKDISVLPAVIAELKYLRAHQA